MERLGKLIGVALVLAIIATLIAIFALVTQMSAGM